MGIAVALLILAGLVVGGIAVVRRVLGKRDDRPGGTGDILAYLLLALAVGVAGFALASLAATAFPGDEFVVDVRGRVANSLAALVVAVPVAVFLWRRQEKRRTTEPESSGWTVYLALIEAVFMTSLVASLFGVFSWIFTDASDAGWTNLVVFAGVVVFHEWAVRRTPPASDAAELPRVVGSAIGLVATVIGLGGLIGWLLSEVYATLTPTAGGSDLGVWVSFLLAGSPVWFYRWLRPWPEEPTTPRNTWMFLTSVAGLAAAIGALTVSAVETLLFLFTETDRAGSHFDFLPETIPVAVIGVAVWAHHRHRMGRERTDPVRAYDYAMSAIGLLTTVGGATALSTVALGRADLVGSDAEAVIVAASALVVGAGLWLWFWMRADRQPREIEAASGPRRFYLIGMSVILGLTSAGSLIATLVIVFQRLLGSGTDESIVVPVSLFVFAGLATWHLLRTNNEDRDLIGAEETLTPFNVTIICSHPGMISTQFPDVARIKVLYRDDEDGVIDEKMAAEIVEAVGHRSAYVWVDDDGYRIAPER